MCVHIDFANIQNVKVVGPKIGSGRGSSKRPRDADNDGKCQEEDGKWIPCPPGVSDGNVIDSAGNAVRKIGATIGEMAEKPKESKLAERRRKAAEKAAKIADEAKDRIRPSQRSAAREIRDLFDELYDGGGGRSRRAIRRDIEETLTDLIGSDITGKDGKRYSFQIDEAEWPTSEQINLRGIIKDTSTGRMIGEFERTFDFGTDSVTHEILKLNDSYQGAGIGSAFNARNEILYREMGMTRIFTHAVSSQSGYKGATHWPRNGFDWANADSKNEFLATIRAALRAHETLRDGNGRSILFDSNQQAEEIKALMEKAGKELLADKDRITANDLLDWPGADKFFQDAFVDLELVRNL